MLQNTRYKPLSSLDEFWRERQELISSSTISEIEKKYCINLPQSLRDLYLISNGGRTDYIFFLKNGKYLSLFQDNTFLPLEEWARIADYIQSYQIDDDEILSINAEFSSARIICRIGFEYFVLYVPEKNSNNAWIGQLDLATAPGDKPKIEFVCSGQELVSGLCKKRA